MELEGLGHYITAAMTFPRHRLVPFPPNMEPKSLGSPRAGAFSYLPSIPSWRFRGRAMLRLYGVSGGL
jgi:hypothetical protein